VAIVYLNLELGALGLPFRTEKAPFGKKSLTEMRDVL